MDNRENEFGSQPVEIEQETRNPEKKKRGFAKLIIIVLIIIIMLGAGLFGLYTVLRSSPQIRNISKDAIAVMRIDFPMLIKKAGLAEPAKDDMLEELREKLEEVNMEVLIDNPKATGLVTLKPSYFFAEEDSKTQEWFGYLVMPISSGKKLSRFLEGITPEDDTVEINVKQQKGKYILEVDRDDYSEEANRIFCAWTDNTLMLGFGTPMDKADKEHKSPSKSVKKRVLQYLDQPRSESIVANPAYPKEMGKKHDVIVWINSGELARRLEIGLKEAKDAAREINQAQSAYREQTESYNSFWNNWSYDSYDPYAAYSGYPEYSGRSAQNWFEEILDEMDYGTDEKSTEIANELIDQLKLLKGSSLLVYSDYTKGEVLSSLRFTPSATLRKEWQSVFEKLGDVKSLAKYLPSEDLVGTASYRINYPQLWAFAQRSMKKTLQSLDDNIGDKMTKRISKFFDGSLLASVNIGSGKEKIPYLTVAASSKKNAGYKDIIKELGKEGTYKKIGSAYKNAYGEDAFVIEGDAVVWTSDYSQYKRSEHGIPAKELGRSISLPLGAFLDVKKMLEIMDADLGEQIMDMMEEYLSIEVKSVSHKGFPDEFIIQTNMKNKKDNSLKVIWDITKDRFEDFDFNDLIPKKETPIMDYALPTDSTYVMPEMPEYDYSY